MIIYNCKYMLPCGWCELREMMCTANEPFVIKYRDDKPIVLNQKDYKVIPIPTKYHQGYMKALEDIEKEVRKRFGFAERNGAMIDHIFGFDKGEEE